MKTETRENKLDSLKAKWFEKGEEAGRKDGWMRPCVDEFDDEDYRNEDDVELVQRDHDGWSGTDHFIILYRKYMTNDLVQTFDFVGCSDEYIEMILDLIESFWDGYDETSGIYDMVKKERKKRGVN